MRRIIIYTLLAILILEIQVCADPVRMNLNPRWTYTVNGTSVNAMVLTDINRDGKKEIILGLNDDTVVELAVNGSKIDEFSLGNASQIGSIYNMDLGDINGDAQDELIFGLGGAKETRTYEPHAFEVSGITLLPSSRVLYRVIRYHGGVYVTRLDGSIIWRHLTGDSVKSVKYFKRLREGGMIAAGIGDIVIMTYNERSGTDIMEETCTYKDITDEESGWSTAADCNNPSKCCSDFKDCSCRWDAVNDICLRSYTRVTCSDTATGEEGWHYVDYTSRNGTVTFLDGAGNIKGTYKVILHDERGMVVDDADNSVRSISAFGLDHNNLDYTVIGSSNGETIVLNMTNMTQLRQRWSNVQELLEAKDINDKKLKKSIEITKVYSGDINADGSPEVLAGDVLGLMTAYTENGAVLWRQKLQDAVTDLRVDDVEQDGSKDIIVSSRDSSIYVFDPQGMLSWVYPSGSPIYGMLTADIDGNGLTDIIVMKDRNVTRYETTEYYVKKYRADSYFAQASAKFDAEDYTLASIYLDKALSLYMEINERDSLQQCYRLRSNLDEEFRVKQKQEADRYYNLALGYYASNDLESALKNIELARKTFEKVNDQEGMAKCDLLKENIRDEQRTSRKIMADGYYAKALSLSTFGNLSEALDFIDKAKSTYAEIDYSNETIKCDMLLISIADRQYRLATNLYQSGDYAKALAYAIFARDIYLKASSSEAAANAADLAQKANISLNKAQVKPQFQIDYTPYLLAAGVLVLLALILRMRAGSMAPKSKSKVLGADEELDSLEKEDA